MSQQPSVLILTTGGTLDKIHDPLTEGIGFPSDETSQLPEILKVCRCSHPRLQAVMQKDSLQITDNDRAEISSAITGAPETAIVVTHGTSTMGETARFLSEAEFDKTIVLTGAMRPYSLSFSDGGFNLGGALIAAQTLPNGVYGVMNGRVFKAQDLHKNETEGRFD